MPQLDFIEKGCKHSTGHIVWLICSFVFKRGRRPYWVWEVTMGLHRKGVKTLVVRGYPRPCGVLVLFWYSYSDWLDSYITFFPSINDWFNSFLFISVFRTDLSQEFCTGKANGMYVDSDNCRGFIECVSEISFKGMCSPGMAFDSQRHLCDYEQNVAGCYEASLV